MQLNLPTVAVLMSTYNGEKYLREQLDSIFAQKDVNLSLYVRDDGSTDSTTAILKSFEAKSNYHWIAGENIGICKSFMQLFYDAPDTDYYAFSDQDDVWYSDKLISAIKMIKGQQLTGVPVLYGSNQDIVDSNGSFLRKRFNVNYVVPTFMRTVLVWGFSGCTMVFNKELRDIMISPEFKLSEQGLEIRNHDQWFHFYAHIFGRTIYDKNSHIYYRRHSTTATDERLPEEIDMLTKYKNRIKNLFFNHKHNIPSKTAKELLNLFSNKLSNDDHENLLALANYQKTFRHHILAFRNNSIRNNCGTDKLILAAKIFLNRL